MPIGFVAFLLVHRRHLQRAQTREAKVTDEISEQLTDGLALGVELPRAHEKTFVKVIPRRWQGQRWNGLMRYR